MPTVITTASGADSNSYATVAQGDTYHTTHLYPDAWNNASQTEKEAALIWATRLIDQSYDFKGYISDIDQALSWPRIDTFTPNLVTIDYETVPQFMVDATAELARKLLEKDRTAEPDTKGFTSISVGSISLTVDKADRVTILPESVTQILNPYGYYKFKGNTARLVRV